VHNTKETDRGEIGDMSRFVYGHSTAIVGRVVSISISRAVRCSFKRETRVGFLPVDLTTGERGMQKEADFDVLDWFIRDALVVNFLSQKPG
jgi:hypothetical protein